VKVRIQAQKADFKVNYFSLKSKKLREVNCEPKLEVEVDRHCGASALPDRQHVN